MMIHKHDVRAIDANGRGMFRAECRCGERFYGPTADDARWRLGQHFEATDALLPYQPKRAGYERSR